MEQVFMKTQKQIHTKWSFVVKGLSLPTVKLLVQSGLLNSLREFTCLEVT